MEIDFDCQPKYCSWSSSLFHIPVRVAKRLEGLMGVTFWFALWALVSGDFKHYSFSCILLDLKAAEVQGSYYFLVGLCETCYLYFYEFSVACLFCGHLVHF